MSEGSSALLETLSMLERTALNLQHGNKLSYLNCFTAFGCAERKGGIQNFHIFRRKACVCESEKSIFTLGTSSINPGLLSFALRKRYLA